MPEDVHEYIPVPPLAENCRVYTTPTTASPITEGLILITLPETVPVPVGEIVNFKIC